jgi:hypothetical protein
MDGGRAPRPFPGDKIEQGAPAFAGAPSSGLPSATFPRSAIPYLHRSDASCRSVVYGRTLVDACGDPLEVRENP